MKVPVKLPPVPKKDPPKRPTNWRHDVGNGINNVVSLPAQAIEKVNLAFAGATNFVANALPAFPAAYQGSQALGTPHAHILHPPSGPAPIPPTPLPPFGPVCIGTSFQVEINSRPAARAGDIGMSPTCCGLPPFYEIFTGSSNVFIGGARAARAIDITYHCKMVPPAGAAARGAAAMLQKAAKAAAYAAMGAGFVGNGMNAWGDSVEAKKTEDPHMAQAMALSATTEMKQMFSDAAALVAGALMGKDLAVPPGTPGVLLTGSPNVLIGGFPMPSWLDIAKGLMKLVRGLRARVKSGKAKAGAGAATAAGAASAAKSKPKPKKRRKSGRRKKPNKKRSARNQRRGGKGKKGKGKKGKGKGKNSRKARTRGKGQ